MLYRVLLVYQLLTIRHLLVMLMVLFSMVPLLHQDTLFLLNTLSYSLTLFFTSGIEVMYVIQEQFYNLRVLLIVTPLVITILFFSIVIYLQVLNLLKSFHQIFISTSSSLHLALLLVIITSQVIHLLFQLTKKKSLLCQE